jgi:hypothetical protein
MKVQGITVLCRNINYRLGGKKERVDDPAVEIGC